MRSERTRQRQHRPTKSQPLPIVDGEAPGRGYARRRAIVLALVYVAFGLHIAHWSITGRSLAPLELNEVMYTLELGIVTAGFLFMCLLVVCTLVFGRFFCSWGCHIIALQDLCGWLLGKLGIRQKPIRSRLLLWVPPLTALYMFLWPQIVRAWQTKAMPAFHLASDSNGWASFVTDNYWRNLPSAGVIVVTFLVCGFLLVYLLGSRTFCTYVCPYGAVFALADRFSPGRIRVSDDCRQCGRCTAACTSGIRVHEEFRQHGMVVNPACLKDLDCLSACPQRAVRFGFGKPSLLAASRTGGRFGSLPYDFAVWEEVLIAVVFVATLLSFRGLYGRVPFLLSLAFGCIAGCIAVMTARLATQPNQRFSTLVLKLQGRLTRTGVGFLAVVAVLLALCMHSGFVRYHEFRGLRVLHAVGDVAGSRLSTDVAASASRHLTAVESWGLLDNERVQRGLIALSARLGRFAEAERRAVDFIRDHPNDLPVHMRLGEALVAQQKHAAAERLYREVIQRSRTDRPAARQAVAGAHQALGRSLALRGAFDEAAQSLGEAVALDPTRSDAFAELGGVLAEQGRFDEAIDALKVALTQNPSMPKAHYNLGTILGHVGRFGEAAESFERALELSEGDADLHNNLGFAYAQTGRTTEAREHLTRAIAISPDHAGAHFNLARLLAAGDQHEEADQHFRLAARLDPRYAELLGLVGSTLDEHGP